MKKIISIFAVLALIFCAIPLTAGAAEDGLVMALEFDEAVSNPNVENLILKDASGKNSIAEIKNPKTKDDTEFPTIKLIEGKFGNALRLNGAQQYIEIKPAVFTHDAVTVAFWVNYRGGTSWQRFFEIGTAETGEHIMMNPSTDTGKFQISGYNKKANNSFISNPTDSAFKFPLNVWTHVAWTMSAEGISSVYINGQVIPMTTIIDKNGAKQTIKNKTAFNTPASFKYVSSITGLENPDWFYARFGCAATSTWDSKLLGSLDSVRVYSKSLSAAEVNQLYSTNSSVVSAGVASVPAGNVNAGTSKAGNSSGIVSAGISSVAGSQGTTSAETSSGPESYFSEVESEVDTGETGSDSVSSKASSSKAAAEDENKNKNGFPVGLIILIIIGAAGIGGGIFLFVTRKK